MLRTLILTALVSFTQIAISAETSGTLTYYLTPAQKNLRYDSPFHLAKSFGLSYLKRELGVLLTDRSKAAMGHAVVGVSCTDTKGVKQNFYSGISGQNLREIDERDVFEDQIGLGVLFRTYEDGYIQDDKKVTYLIGAHRGRLYVDSEQNVRRQPVNFLSFEITATQCDALVDFWQAFKSKRFQTPPTLEEVLSFQKNEPLYFTVAIDPYESYLTMKEKNQTPAEARLGGGCTSYAQAFLKIAGVHEPIFDQFFLEHLQIGESLIGKPEQGYQVSPKRALTARAWSKPGEPTRPLSMYHPEYVWRFFEGAKQCLAPHHRYPSDYCQGVVQDWVESKQARLEVVEHTINFRGEKTFWEDDPNDYERNRQIPVKRIVDQSKTLQGVLVKLRR